MNTSATDPETQPSAAVDESPLVKAIRDGSAPLQVKLAAVRGALPVDRPELFGLLVILRNDSDNDVKSAAEASLSGWTDEELLALAETPQTAAEALDYILTDRSDTSGVLAALLSNASTPLPALEAAARSFPASKLDTLFLNQTLLIRHPVLLEHLEINDALTPLHQARIREIRRHFLGETEDGIVVEPAEHETPLATAETAAAAAPPVEATPPRSPSSAETPGEQEQTSDLQPADSPGEDAPADASEEESGNKPPKGVYERILAMNITQKLTLANKGSKEERSILIRQANRLVQSAVIKSPKLTVQEVEAIAKMRSVNEEVLRVISQKRDWMKSYAIIHGLTLNPKTPLGISMTLLSRLVLKDLKMILRDKNVPETLRRMARKNIELRDKKGRR